MLNVWYIEGQRCGNIVCELCYSVFILGFNYLFPWVASLFLFEKVILGNTKKLENINLVFLCTPLKKHLEL